jgi:nicotinate-nucleotide adenylyltransferase
MSNKRVGIYAGTFDPIHTGHLAFAEQALAGSNLDKLFFLVEPRPRNKQGVRALLHREEMVRLAIEDNAKLGIIQLEHSNFTVEETLPKLQALFEGAELHFLMGEDVFAHLNAWPNINELLASSSFIIGIRKNDEKKVQQILKRLEKTRGIKFKTDIIVTRHHEITSSNIRLALKGGQKPQGLISETAAYIKENSLYKSSSVKNNRGKA